MEASQTVEDARTSLGRGDLANAERLLRAVVDAEPEQAEALHLLGLVAHRQGDELGAREWLERSVRSDPARAEGWTALAEILRTMGETDEAIESGERAVFLSPAFAPALNNLGLALQEAGRLEESESRLRAAIELNTSYAKAHYNLGNVLRLGDRREEAEREFREALRLQPKYPQALNGLGVILGDAGRFEDAAGCFESAIRMAPRYPKPLLNYGNLLAGARRFGEALRCYDQALHLQSDYAEAWLAKASLLQVEEKYDQALAAIEHAAPLRPADPEIPFRRGQVEFARYAYPRAAASFRTALELEPEHAGARCALAQVNGETCQWADRDEEMAAVRRAIAAAREAGEPAPLPPFVTFLPFEPEELLNLAVDFAQRVFRDAAFDRSALGAPATRPAATSSRLKLGYLSSDFRNHAVTHMSRSLYGLHDRERFEVVAYSIGADDGSEYRKAVVADCDAFVDLRDVTDTEAARRLRSDRVDVLIDLTGFTRGNRCAILARRPAPIQVSWLYPATTGGVFHDYLITDAIVTPPEHAARFGESLALLPHCYHVTDHQQPIAREVPTRPEEGLPGDAFVFCCFNKLAKIDGSIFGAWMRILEAVPGSVLWLADGPAFLNLRREAERRGIAGDRLRPRRFAATKPEHLARHRLADLFLDTRVFAAHTTAADALRAGLPLLTSPGETFASRVAASMLHAVGLPDMVVTDIETYQRRAIELARNPPRLEAVRRQLSTQRKTHPLFDTPRFVRNLEHAYLAMWSRHEAGEAPAMLVVQET